MGDSIEQKIPVISFVKRNTEFDGQLSALGSANYFIECSANSSGGGDVVAFPP